MSSPKKPHREEEEIIFLETESRDDVARALEEAERSIRAVEEKHRRVAQTQTALAEPEPVPVPAPSPAPAPPPPVPPPPALPDPWIEVLEEKLAKEKERSVRAEEDAGRNREALLRKSADFDNLKRRTEKDKAEYFRFALSEAFVDILNVVDNFDRALQHRGDATGDEFHAGIDMIARQLAETLKKYGVTEVPPQDLFDPNVHEAVVREETEAVAPGTVLEVFQKGYLLHDRLLRPARVKVAAKPGAKGREELNEEAPLG